MIGYLDQFVAQHVVIDDDPSTYYQGYQCDGAPDCETAVDRLGDVCSSCEPVWSWLTWDGDLGEVES